MSVTLNNSDFQCLQDQLLELKNKNYELAEKNRRGQADFEAAKAKICSLQLKLEEQERDFQLTSTTLRREIESTTASLKATSLDDQSKGSNDVDHKAENKKLLLKIEELQQHQSEMAEIVQQMDAQNEGLTTKVRELEVANSDSKELVEAKKKELEVLKKDYEKKLNTTITDYKTMISEERKKHANKLEAVVTERDSLKTEKEKLSLEVQNFNSRLESQAEERKIQDRKGLRIVKELKRQLALEKTKTETLQKRLENLLSEPPTDPVTDLDEATRSRLSTSSSNNENGSSSNENGSRANQDANSVGSWSFVAGKSKSSNQALNGEALSICSIESEDRETVQEPPHDSDPDKPAHTEPVNEVPSDQINPPPSPTTSVVSSPMKTTSITSNSLLQSRIDGLRQSLSSPSYSSSHSINDGLLLEEQAALVERLTKMQHDKWTLEEKLSYLEQANSSLTEDLANKSDIIRHYFMDQAIKVSNNPNQHHHDNLSTSASYSNTNNNNGQTGMNISARRTSFPANVSHLLSEKPNLKKVVDFLKERSQISSGDSDNISKEATKKMQLMLEETLIKCLKLQENLDSVTTELNKMKS